MFKLGTSHIWRKPDEFEATKGESLPIMLKGRRLCNVSSWMFNACAAGALEGWNYFSHTDTFNKPEVVDAFLEFLQNPLFPNSPYYPREFYILESSSQRRYGLFKELCSRPQLKLVDQYKNKSHAPNELVYLWRLSLDEDFTS